MAAWDDSLGETVLQRTKEAENDYRYFPEPDLPPLVIDPEWIESMLDKAISDEEYFEWLEEQADNKKPATKKAATKTKATATKAKPKVEPEDDDPFAEEAGPELEDDEIE